MIDFPTPTTLWQQYFASNGVMYEWNGKGWAVVGGSGGSSTPIDFPVDSVNGMTGDVVLDFPVGSVNGMQGDVVLTHTDVGAAPAVHNHDAEYVNVTGDTMTGPLTLPAQAAGTRNNTAATMQMFASEFPVSLGTAGYQRLPSGLIIQWGYGNPYGVGVQYTSFPIAFPNYVFQVMLTNASNASPVALSLSAADWNAAGFYAYTSNGAGWWVYSWVAFGY